MKKIFSIVLMASVLATTIFSVVPVFAQDSYVMKVVADGITTYYDDFGEGWVNAVETAEDTPTTVTLYRDWYAGDTNSNGVIDSDETPGYFKYYNKDGEEFGTENGALSTGERNAIVIRFINLTLDLNGHTISRNLESPVEDGNVFCIEAGNIYIKDSSEAQTGKITGGNTTSSGGAFIVDDLGEVFIENCEISGNYAQEMGGGIYITGNETAVSLNNVKLTGNKAGSAGGGFAIGEDSPNMFCFEDIYLGGDTVIWGNERFDGTQDNLYFPYIGLSNAELCIKHCMGQRSGVPYSPLTKNARIGVSAEYDNFEMTCEDSNFNLESYKQFISDDSEHYIRPVYDSADKTNLHQLYYTLRGNSEVTTPHIRTVTVKDENLIKRKYIDMENQVITLTAYKTKKNHFNFVSLNSLITYEVSDDTDVVVGRDDICSLLTPRKYRVMGKDRTYELCTVQVVPDGGEWAAEQEEVNHNYVMTADDGERFCTYSDFETGWTEAIPMSQKRPTTVTLLSDWIAPDNDGDGNGDFYYENSSGSEYGTDEGRLHLATDTIDITLDLNGHTINRNLSSSKEHGQVFRIEDGSLTIKDSSEAQTGKITGGNNNGNGGAFYMDDGSLYLEGGEISGNKSTQNGGGIYATNASDTYVYIKGGKVCNNSADINGGGIYMYNGYLYVDGGEISDNKAVDGAGVYWNSRNAGCFTGGKITGNKASSEGGGIYGADWGEIYLGGTAVIVDNKNAKGVESNLYLCENDVDINHTRGQADGIPNKPLTDGADIGITSVDTYDLISGGDSCFDQGSFGYLHADDDHTYYIRSVFDADEGNNSHQLWYTAWADTNARYPRVKTVAVLNDNILDDAKLDYNTQTITIKAYMDASDAFKSVRLDSLISYTFDHEGEYILDADQPRDLSTPQEYKIMSDNGTYVTCMVKVDWYCAQHKDSDGNYICDYCEEYTLTYFTILNYNAQANEATVFVPEAGKYTLIFADYDGNKLENVDIVEYDFNEGINVIPQEARSFTLANGDKVMLWYDMVNLIPICEALTLE